MKAKVYGKDNCPYCVKAKELLEDKGIAFEYVDIKSSGIDTTQLSQLCGRQVTTVPQIFLDDEHVGGFDDLNARLTEEQEVMSFDIEL
ncbi:putative thioredoxin [Aeromonas phage D6]|uniref:Thioredoxin n=1 Tax=Aeromonas phage D6 TaxID=2593322 RepID=A0A514TWN5_9CAUD|nr:thioredoxin domain [Aeromonas phage D6]QDJ97434.1 putative thioredoxin [Aeromonas phage D6]